MQGVLTNLQNDVYGMRSVRSSVCSDLQYVVYLNAKLDLTDGENDHRSADKMGSQQTQVLQSGP